MNNEAIIQPLAEHQARILNTGLAIFDSGQFENLYRVAEALGKSSLIPASLRGKTDEETTANCLLVVEHSHRWRLSPFAVAQCASVVHGRLMWEGKLVHAVIQSLSGINLLYDISGTGEAMKVVVSGTLPGEDKPRTVEGTVKQWKTTGNGSPWANPEDHPRQLRYRGAREWSRAHNPAVMLGILADDEVLPDSIRDVTPRPGKAVLRETMIEPFQALVNHDESLPYPGTATQKAAAKAEPKPAAEEPVQDTNSEEKEVIEYPATFTAIAEKANDKRTWFEASFLIKGKALTFYTFSQTLAGSLREVESKTKMLIKVSPTSKPDRFTLVGYTIIEEGGLV